MVRRRRAAQHNGGNMKTLFAAVLLAVTFAGFGAANAVVATQNAPMTTIATIQLLMTNSFG
jgi:hypothetical protein